jgi:hypothetical protein
MSRDPASTVRNDGFRSPESRGDDAGEHSDLPCLFYGKSMAIGDAHDYTLSDDTPWRTMRVAWWSCACGHREVLAQDVLS